MLLPRPGDGAGPLPPGSPELDDAAIAAAYPWPEGAWARGLMVGTLDGRAAGPDGLSGSISGPADRRVMGVLRTDADAVLVGAGTVRAERYSPPRRREEAAARRVAEGRGPVHRLAVVTRSADLPLDLPFLAEASDDARPLVVTWSSPDAGRRAALAEVADVVVAGDDGVDLPAAVAALHDRGLVRLLAEGGPHLLHDLLAAGLLDELDLTVSPLAVGGEGPRLLAGGVLPGSPVPFALAGVLEDDGMLFLRLLRGTGRCEGASEA